MNLIQLNSDNMFYDAVHILDLMMAKAGGFCLFKGRKMQNCTDAKNPVSISKKQQTCSKPTKYIKSITAFSAVMYNISHPQ